MPIKACRIQFAYKIYYQLNWNAHGFSICAAIAEGV